MSRWKVVETDKDPVATNGILEHLPDKSGRVRALRQWSHAPRDCPNVVTSD
jgi:hypothetical protein